MHTTDGGIANVPAFLTKLWKLVEDPRYNDLIAWAGNGRSFIIHNQTRFAKDLLPLYFKHNNMASFIRQLNMYGFRKSTSIENSGLRADKDEMEFYHQYFLRGQENMLEFIKRKVPGPGKNILTPAICDGTGFLKTDDVREMLSGIQSIRDRQDNTDNCLITMQQENAVLWKEIALLRQKHAKQQQIIEKLIHFLMSIVSSPQGMSMKRKAQLMIDSSDGNHSLFPNGVNGNKRFHSKDSQLDSGPVIHDVTNDELEAELEAGANCNPIVSHQMDPIIDEVSQPGISNLLDSDSILDPLVGMNGVPVVDSNLNQGSSSRSTAVPFEETSSATAVQMTLPSVVTTQTTTMTSASLPVNLVLDNFTKEYFTNQVEGIDIELSWLRDQLTSGGLNIDPGSLSGCFSTGSISPTSTAFTSSNKR